MLFSQCRQPVVMARLGPYGWPEAYADPDAGHGWQATFPRATLHSACEVLHWVEASLAIPTIGTRGEPWPCQDGNRNPADNRVWQPCWTTHPRIHASTVVDSRVRDLDMEGMTAGSTPLWLTGPAPFRSNHRLCRNTWHVGNGSQHQGNNWLGLIPNNFCLSVRNLFQA